MSVEIPEFTEDLNIIQSLDDQPSLTASELKAKFDEGTNKIKDYINNILISAVQDAIDEMETIGAAVDTKITDALKARYYVGSIIVSSVAKNPATYLGFGTWEQTGQGRVEIGVDSSDSDFNTVGETGGHKTITLQANQIPTLSIGTAVTNISQDKSNKADLTYNGTVVTNVSKTTGTLKYTNNNLQSINITPKYITVYRYKRVA